MKSTLLYGFLLFLIILAVFLLPQFTEKNSQGHLTLLTVSNGETLVGGTADVYLELRPGKGNVYIDTHPFTKLDTQVSTRFAQQIACHKTGIDCSHYDFFYTLRAGSSIVGGPSAGAALTTLTMAVLHGDTIDQGVAMTGTINSGGIVGPVSGIKQKIQAAQEAGMHTVLIPKWGLETENISELTEYLDIKVIEVSTIDEALSIITGKNYSTHYGAIAVSSDYSEIMKKVSDVLCQRSTHLKELVEHDTMLYNTSELFLQKAQNAHDQKDYYSRASYCYTANLRLKELQLHNVSVQELDMLARDIQLFISGHKKYIRSKSLNTMADVQTKAIVDERLQEAEDYLSGNLSSQKVAYAIERYYSALAWSSFFKLGGEQLQLDQEHLLLTCESKLAEVEERKSYLSYILGYESEQQNLQAAYNARTKGDYALCIFKASKVKAENDLVISSTLIDGKEFNAFTREKLLIDAQVINQEIRAKRFPLMGYSYYEYAKSLQESDPYLAALFASYSLELSDLSRYFPKEQNVWQRITTLLNHDYVLGYILGLFTMVLFYQLMSRNKH